jgi:hypothetical protein
MATIKIDGVDYNTDDISDKGKEQLASIRFAQNEIQSLEARIAVCKTALAAYTKALQSELNN